MRKMHTYTHTHAHTLYRLMGWKTMLLNSDICVKRNVLSLLLKEEREAECFMSWVHHSAHALSLIIITYMPECSGMHPVVCVTCKRKCVCVWPTFETVCDNWYTCIIVYAIFMCDSICAQVSSKHVYLGMKCMHAWVWRMHKHLNVWCVLVCIPCWYMCHMHLWYTHVMGILCVCVVCVCRGACMCAWMLLSMYKMYILSYTQTATLFLQAIPIPYALIHNSDWSKSTNQASLTGTNTQALQQPTLSVLSSYLMAMWVS